jgi:hypothetical protein
LSLVGRFTKDRVSAKVWWPFALVLIGSFVLTFPGEQRAIDTGATSGVSALFIDTPRAWLWYRVALGVAAGLVLLLALLSLRRSKARIGWGVPFYRESVPASFVLMEADRARELEGAAGLAKERIATLERNLRESEAARNAMEIQLRDALDALEVGASSSTSAKVSVLPSAPAESEAEPKEQAHELVAIPDIDPRPEASDPVTARTGWPEVVVMPAAVARPVSVAPPADESAVDMLNRMVDPVESPHVGNDPSLLRSKLARTAALKKPGSRERRDPDLPEQGAETDHSDS